MNARLEQLLAYLDRDGVSELVIATGRPLAVRQGGSFLTLNPRPLARDELDLILAGTPIVVPTSDGMRPPLDVTIGRRALRVRVGKRGAEVVIRVEKGGIAEIPMRARGATRAPRTTAAPRNKVVTTAPRTKAATMAPRAKAASVAPRAKAASIAPRTKAASVAPRTKAPSVAPRGRAKAATAAPRTRPVTAAPRATATAAPRATAPAAAHDSAVSQFDPTELTLDDLAPEPMVVPAATPPPPIAIAPEVARAVALELAPDRVASGRFAELVARARARGATDLHVISGRQVLARVAGELVPLEPNAPALPAAVAEAMLLALLDGAQQARLASVGYVDLAVEAPGGGRLRTNLARHQGGLKGSFRLAHAAPSSLEQLGLPKELAKVVSHHQGLVVVAGPSGHGKTTTLAALVDVVNASRAFHIITVEDPIEIVHPRKVAIVSQREAGRHTKSFAAALKGSLREDPDVIVIGELRDRETVEIALTAAETGHLVLSTMSTPSAAKTIDRLIDMFPAEEHAQVRASIAGALRAIVAQRLLPAHQGGVVPAIELVTGVLPLAVLIRDDKLYQLPNLMQRGKAFGMMRFDDSLLELLRAGKISEQTALAATDNKKELAATLRPGARGPG